MRFCAPIDPVLAEVTKLEGERYGYRAEMMDASPYKGRERRLGEVLHNRGIDGIVIGSMTTLTAARREQFMEALNGNDFALVAFPPPYPVPTPFPVTWVDFYVKTAAEIVWHEIHRRACCRCGAVLPQWESPDDNRYRKGGSS